MSKIGLAIGAITFTGSVVVVSQTVRPDERRSHPPAGAPCHQYCAARYALIVLIVVFVRRESYAAFWLIALVSFALGVLMIVPIGGADMPVVISMLNSYSGWAAAGIGFTVGNAA